MRRFSSFIRIHEKLTARLATGGKDTKLHVALPDKGFFVNLEKRAMDLENYMYLLLNRGPVGMVRSVVDLFLVEQETKV